MAKNKVTAPEILDEEIREEEQPSVKGPLRDDPEPAYTPAWQVVNQRQDVYSDKFPPKIYSLDAMMAAGIVNEEALAAYLDENKYVKQTDYASADAGGTVKISSTYGLSISATYGIVQGASKNATQYGTSADALIISKGTLEAVFLNVLTNKLIASIPTWDSAASGTNFRFSLVKDEGGGGHLKYTTVTP